MTDTAASPAVQTPCDVSLHLEGSPQMPRRLIISVSARGSFSLFVYRPRRRGARGMQDSLGRPFSYASAIRISECRLIRGDALWIGQHAAFDVTTAESARIEAAFAAAGLRVEDKAP